MQEKRVSERVEVPLEINVFWPETKQTKQAVTKDFSDDGAFVLVTFEPQPLIGSEILLQLNRLVLGKEPPIIKPQVVRATNEGLALEFVKDMIE